MKEIQKASPARLLLFLAANWAGTVLLSAHSSVSRYSRSQTYVYMCGWSWRCAKCHPAAAAALVSRRYTNFNFPKVAYSWISQRARQRSSVFVIMFYGCHMSWPSFSASLVSLAIPRRSRRSRIRPANNFLILRHTATWEEPIYGWRRCCVSFARMETPR